MTSLRYDFILLNFDTMTKHGDVPNIYIMYWLSFKLKFTLKWSLKFNSTKSIQHNNTLESIQSREKTK